ncbi:Lipase class 3 [Penicillium bovifimosum]|uniref:Lipase class 3 n=1 Tax=Penicillium bovifimosum TaxID=126998 RepID=A0A9W9HFY8_9EURO|nr:Lipase class 3 [Penicillium bovifimosum]KAJ5146541.1 Lipase class 3 [Penicillium bovifimosum]
MMRLLAQLSGVAALAVLAVAAPARWVPRDVSSDLLAQLTLYSQWAGASYCTNNINSTGDALSCEEGNCPLVEAADTETLYEFDKSCSYGNVAGFLAVDRTNQLLVVSFRGSRTLSTWLANINFDLTDASSLCPGCEAHDGFLQSWETVADDLTAKIAAAQATYSGYTLVLTGHSFGAAVAALGGTALRNAGYAPNVYSYGQPRVGNKALATYITNQGSIWRVTHTEDLVPKLPPAAVGFSHSSPEYWITSGDDVPVTASDIEVIEGVGSRDGNAGTLSPNVDAHSWKQYSSSTSPFPTVETFRSARTVHFHLPNELDHWASRPPSTMLFAPSGPQGPRRRSRLKAIFITIFIVLAIYLIFFPTKATVNTDTYAQQHAKTDELAHPESKHKTMVVASMKHDDTSWLTEYFPDWPKSIYVVDDKHARLTVTRNKGRESMVYLTYIIDNYDNLPETMLFIHSKRYQWHNDDPYYDGVPPLRNFQIPYLQEQGYVNLRCVWTLGCPTEIRPLTDTHRNDVHAGEYFKNGFMELFPGTPIPEEVGVSCCAQFAVSRDKVLERPLSDYERFRTWLLNTPLQDDLSGRIMEYSWHMIFGKEPVHCPNAAECYCKVFGLCDLNCPWEGGCDDRYALPPFSSLPKGWPNVGWKGQAQDTSHGLPET